MAAATKAKAEKKPSKIKTEKFSNKQYKQEI